MRLSKSRLDADQRQALEAVIMAGQRMANVLFNLAQASNIPPQWKEIASNEYKRFDIRMDEYRVELERK